jgi:hypothetical protein
MVDRWLRRCSTLQFRGCSCQAFPTSVPHAHTTPIRPRNVGIETPRFSDPRARTFNSSAPQDFFTVLCWCFRSGQGRKGVNLWLPEFLTGPLVECQGRVGFSGNWIFRGGTRLKAFESRGHRILSRLRGLGNET